MEESRGGPPVRQASRQLSSLACPKDDRMPWMGQPASASDETGPEKRRHLQGAADAFRFLDYTDAM